MERVGIIAVKFEKTMWLALPSLWSRRRRRKRRKRAIGAGAGVGWLSPHANSRHLLHWNTCSVSGFLVFFFFSCFNFVLHELQWPCQTLQTILSYRIRLEQNSVQHIQILEQIILNMISFHVFSQFL